MLRPLPRWHASSSSKRRSQRRCSQSGRSATPTPRCARSATSTAPTAMTIGVALLETLGNDDLGIARVLGAAPQIDPDRFRVEAAIAKAATEPEAAVEDALRLPASKSANALTAIATAWAKDDVLGALAHVDYIEDNDRRNAFKGAVLRQWALDDPEALLAYVLDLSADEQDEAMRKRHAVRTAERARAVTRARGRRSTRGRGRGHGPAHGVDAARGRRPVGRPAPRRVAAVGCRAPASIEHDRDDVRPARPGGRHRVGAKPKRAGAAVERAGRRCTRQCRSRNGFAAQHSRRRAATDPANARDGGQLARRTVGSDRRSFARTAEPRTGFADADQQLGATHTRGGAALAAREQPIGGELDQPGRHEPRSNQSRRSDRLSRPRTERVARALDQRRRRRLRAERRTRRGQLDNPVPRRARLRRRGGRRRGPHCAARPRGCGAALRIDRLEPGARCGAERKGDRRELGATGHPGGRELGARAHRRRDRRGSRQRRDEPMGRRATSRRRATGP